MSNTIESHLVEDRIFKPSKAFSAKARISSMAEYKKLWQESIDKPKKFWAREGARVGCAGREMVRRRQAQRL